MLCAFSRCVFAPISISVVLRAPDIVCKAGRNERAGFLFFSAYHAVLAVKDEREYALAACGGLAILDGSARRDPEILGNPAQDISRIRS